MSYVQHGHRHGPKGSDPTPGSSGGGLEFNAGTYGPDNVGDWLVVEATDLNTGAFSVASNANPADTFEGGVGIGFNTKYGAMFTLTADAPNDAYALNVLVYGVTGGYASCIEAEAQATGAGSANSLDALAHASGTGGAVGVSSVGHTTSGSAVGVSAASISSGSGLSRGVEGLGTSQSGDTVGGYFQGDAGSSGTPLVQGVYAVGVSRSTGDAVGGEFKATNSGGGSSFPLRLRDAVNAVIFEVWDDGSIHGKTGAGPVLFDL